MGTGVFANAECIDGVWHGVPKGMEYDGTTGEIKGYVTKELIGSTWQFPDFVHPLIGAQPGFKCTFANEMGFHRCGAPMPGDVCHDEEDGTTWTVQEPGTAVQRYADRAMFEAAPMTSKVPKVHLLWMTPDPLGAIAAACRMYEGKPTYSMADITDDERRHYWQQVQQTHLQAPLEFVKLHFFIEGVDRAFTHQIVRQRTAVYAQESLRFAVKENMANETPFPPSFHDIRVAGNTSGKNVLEDIWDTAIVQVERAYRSLIAAGVPAEDARGLLPHATLTRLNYCTDLRNLGEHAGNRLCTQAQFVWRAVFQGIREAIRAQGMNLPSNGEDAQWWQYEMIANSALFSPICYKTGKCEFASKMDRGCTIRERVDNGEFNMIHPDEWASDPQAGWVR